MIDHRTLKVMLAPEPPLQPSAPPEDAPKDAEPVSVMTQCPVCHWGLKVTVTPLETVG